MLPNDGAQLDWSYSDQAQHDTTAKKGRHWSWTGSGVHKDPVAGAGTFFLLPQRQHISTFAHNI